MSKNEKLKRVVLKEEMVAVTGNAINALILNQMVYWTEILNQADQEIYKEIEEYQKLGLDRKAEKTKSELRNGWFWKSAKELAEELMDISSRATIDRKLKELVDDGFLETKKNENNPMDKKNHYRVNLDFLRKELKKLGYALEGYAIPEDDPQPQEEEKPYGPDNLETLKRRIAQNEHSQETLILRIAQNEHSIAHNEHSIAHHKQTYTEITTETTSETTFKHFVNKEILKFCNSNYTKFAPGRWTKDQWLTMVNKYATDFIKDKKYDEVQQEKWPAYVYGSLKKMAYKHDLKKQGKRKSYEEMIEERAGRI